MTRPAKLRIGIVASRLGGTDGVSMEAEAWSRVFRELGHEVHWFAGLIEAPREPCREVPLAFFGHPEIVAINPIVFGTTGPATHEGIASSSPGIEAPRRDRPIRRVLGSITAELQRALDDFVRESGLQLLVTENTLSLPIHLPLGLAITRLAADTGIPVLAHHHDLPWERQRFAAGDAQDIIDEAFPPTLPNVHHVCINTQQQREIRRRIGREARVIPNVVALDEETAEEETAEGDDAVEDLRSELRSASDELLVLQPTRVVQRKGIEHALELVRRLDRPAKLFIIGTWGDEGLDYGQHIDVLARLLGVDIVWASDRVAARRGVRPDGSRVYSLDDAFEAADLVTYPSLIEGFGRAFLAAARHRRLIAVNRYPVYDLDIRPHGFKVIEMDGFVSEQTVAQTRALLRDADTRKAWADHNYELVRRFFSVDVLRRELQAALADIFG